MPSDKCAKFADLSFDDFRRMATDASLSRYEKIGFPDSYRKGKEKLIFQDIKRKLGLLNKKNKVVLDIGPGCSELPLMLIDLCRRNNHKLIMIDSKEMLAHLPTERFMKKIPGYYPHCDALYPEYIAKVDVILSYSVLHYVFAESNVWSFLDKSLELLSEGGEMLIGDIPNISKRKRFFNSSTGIRFHQNFTGTTEIPKVTFNKIESGQIDDAVMMGLAQRARNQGFDAYILPQPPALPMANRREDILIKRP